LRRFTVHPVSLAHANEGIVRWHRHSGAVLASLNYLELRESGRPCGVGILGRPLAQVLDDGVTLEVRRTATDGTEHACSAVLGALYRAARRRRALRMVTYTREGETGASLRAAGWWLDADYHRQHDFEGPRLVTRLVPKEARSWNSPSRPRKAKENLGAPRFRWWRLMPDACTFEGALALGAVARDRGQVSGQPFQSASPAERWWKTWSEGYDYPAGVDVPRMAA
jgi:hypothetical protein